MTHRILLSLGVALCLLLFTARPAAAAETPPNIVVIFIDDMGYADIGPFGAEDYDTPHLDRMAKEGRVFTDFLVSSGVCSASRAALMTGSYHRRVDIRGALGPGRNRGLNPDEVTLAEICKQKGYATACFGKWHLGHHPKFLPTNHGFDEYFGLPYSNDMWPYHPNVRHLPMEKRLERWPHLPLIEGTKVINPKVSPDDQRQLTTQITERSVDFIKRNKDRPFFLYVPHPMVHVPLYVSDKFKGKSGAGLYGDVVMEVDWSVGQILSTLRKHDLDENTLVLFTSDNGPWLSYGTHAGSAGPLREGKGTSFEGGVREPTIFWWPGRIPAGTKTDKLASTIDILPTVAELIGAKLPDHKIDGHDIRPLLFGHDGAESPHEAFAIYFGRQLQAIRDDRFKVVFPHRYRTMAGKPGGTDGTPNSYSHEQAELALYDLDSDIGETTDVQDKHPQVFNRLQQAADQVRKELGEGGNRGPGVRPAGRMQKGDKRLQ